MLQSSADMIMSLLHETPVPGVKATCHGAPPYLEFEIGPLYCSLHHKTYIGMIKGVEGSNFKYEADKIPNTIEGLISQLEHVVRTALRGVQGALTKDAPELTPYLNQTGTMFGRILAECLRVQEATRGPQDADLAKDLALGISEVCDERDALQAEVARFEVLAQSTAVALDRAGIPRHYEGHKAEIPLDERVNLLASKVKILDGISRTLDDLSAPESLSDGSALNAQDRIRALYFMLKAQDRQSRP